MENDNGRRKWQRKDEELRIRGVMEEWEWEKKLGKG